MMSTVHTSADGEIIQFTKGAPDELLKLCTHYWEDGEAKPLNADKLVEIVSKNSEMASRALRVLALSFRQMDTIPTEDDCTPQKLEQSLCFVGLMGMIDPVRPEVKDAIHRCREAGIKPIMITGDHADTATAIAKELGILDPGQRAITGIELDSMSDEVYARRVTEIPVYARVQPEHKVRIVTAWQNAGNITAMTGDGVNDAPSIKTADIGVGMGITGTDVTKNVADMVLTDDNFATIVNAVEEGRRIYDNIRKAIQFLLGANMVEIIGIFVATLLGFQLLKPIHLLFINLVTDAFPALALGLEKAEPDIMQRNPRDTRAGIFSGGLGSDIAYQGFMVASLTLAAYFIGHFIESGRWEIANSADGMTMAFLTMCNSQIFHSFSMRSQRKSILSLRTKNHSLLIAGIASFLVTITVVYIPFLAEAFHLEHISLTELLISIVLSACTIPIVEIVKFFQRKSASARGAEKGIA
jgi:Ca2+-transporting ATPase